jgi:Leucine-rich repeat (LRR) protein
VCVCSHNQLVDLPGEMSSLVNLVSLHLEHNKLTMLGEYLKHLEQLEELVSELFG